MDKQLPGRRGFLKQLAAFALAEGLQGAAGSRAADLLPNPVGYATIAWPESQFDEALGIISGLGFKGVQILGWVREAYADARTVALRERLRALKLQPVTLSCSDVVLDPSKPGNDNNELRAYAEFFPRLGGLYLQVTDGGNPTRSYPAATIRQLGARMTEMGKVAQDHALTLGYHPHFGTIGETREGLGRVLEATDPRYVKLIADVAHLTLGGVDPAEVIRTYHERLILTHFKDVRPDIAALVGKNRKRIAAAEDHFCEIGTGAVNFPAILDAFRATHFKGWVIIELDSSLPGGQGPADGARANKAAIRKLGFQV